MGITKIEWAEKTWNPITGCTKVSEGCRNCYAERMSKRLAGRYGYPKDDPFRVTFHPDRLDQPLHWKKPSTIFVCSMGDLFHQAVCFQQIAAVFGIMAATPRHTYVLLTKRPYEMRQWFERMTDYELGDCEIPRCWAYSMSEGRIQDFDVWPGTHRAEWPLPNVYLGVTVENQQAADERIPTLLQIPAAGHWLSIEPMLSAIELGLLGTAPKTWGYGYKPVGDLISGVILGGESGPGARPMHPDWARGVRYQCEAAGVPFMFKQWGAWAPAPNAGIIRYKEEVVTVGDADMRRLGAKRAGRLLDGREHNETAWEMPA